MQFILSPKLVFISLLMFILTGCGGSGGKNSNTSTPSAEAPAPVVQNFAFNQSGPLNLLAGDVLTNQAIGQGSGAVTYASGNTAVATVDTSGQVNVIGAGEAVITARKAADSKYLAATASFIIHAISVNQTFSFAQSGTINLLAGQSLANPATGQGSGAITYHSSNSAVATVDSNGLVNVTVIGTGTTLITANKAADPHYNSASASYIIEASGANQTLSFAQPGPLQAKTNTNVINLATGQGSSPVVYSSSNPTIASVNSDGLVALLGEGRAVITATKAADANYLAVTASYEINISRSSQLVSFNQTGPIDLLTGDTLTNQARAQGTGSLTYHSSDTAVATVDNSGLVTVVGGGSAVVTATVAADSKYLGAAASYTINAGIPMTAWVGSRDTQVSFPAALNNVEFYRSSAETCDFSNYLSCADGQMNLLDGSTLTDTAARINRTGYYLLQKGSQQAKLALKSDSGNPASSFPFKTRNYARTAVFNNKLWLIGGQEPNDPAFKNDIWSSTDGISWREEVAQAAFPGFSSSDLLVFNNKLWLLTGDSQQLTRETWSSADGINWVKEATHLTPPFYLDNKFAVFNNKLWLIGTTNNGDTLPQSAVWSTIDGKNWTLEANVNLPVRTGATLTIFNNQLWLIGGFSDDKRHNDTWSSSDGIVWVQRTANAAFPGRLAHTATVFNNKLWIIGGADNNWKRLNDIWSSTDGINWTQEADAAPFSPRVEHSVVIYNNHLMMFGGRTSIEGPTYTDRAVSDVWASEDGKEWRAGYRDTFHFAH